MQLRILISVILCLALVGAAYGQKKNQLGVGDSAPGLDIETWLNGNEVASGSIRIHERNIQEQVFQTLQLGTEEVESRFVW